MLRRAITANQTDTAIDAGSSVLVGTASTEVVDRNQNRIEVTLCNDSSAVIYLSLGRTAEVGKGIRINPNGGSFFTMNYLGPINAVATEADANLTVTEL